MDIQEFYNWLTESRTVTMDDVVVTPEHKEPIEDMFFVNKNNNNYAMIDDSNNFVVIDTNTVMVIDCDNDKFIFKRIS